MITNPNERCYKRKLAITFSDVGGVCAETRQAGRTRNSFADGTWHGTEQLSSRTLPTLPVNCSTQWLLRDGETGKYEFSSQEAVRSDVSIALRMAESVTVRNWIELVSGGACVFEHLMDCIATISYPSGEDDGGKSKARWWCSELLKKWWKYQICWT